MTASRSVLLGIVPVLMHPPPTTRMRSTTATRLPSFAACTAARCPPGPLPSTTTSTLVTGMRSIPFGRHGLRRFAAARRRFGVGRAERQVQLVVAQHLAPVQDLRRVVFEEEVQ